MEASKRNVKTPAGTINFSLRRIEGRALLFGNERREVWDYCSIKL